MKAIASYVLACTVLAAPAAAQEQAQQIDIDTSAVDEMSRMIDSIQARIDKMNDAAGKRDETIDFLNSQIEKAIGTLTSRQDENLALRQKTVELSSELDLASTTREELGSEVSRVASERDRIFAELDAQVQAFADLLALEQETTARLQEDLAAREAELKATLSERDDLGQKLSAAYDSLAAEKERNALQLRELEAAGTQHGDLEARLVALTTAHDESEAELAAARARNAELEAQLAGYAASEVDLKKLNGQLSELRKQIVALNTALEASESTNQQQQVTIADLGKRLNLALAAKVQELAKYRSDFFGRLRDVLGTRADLRIVGDRFVFQSEVLFDSGEAEIGIDGKQKLLRLADSLKEVAATIPPDIDWVLRVDGHTDARPIQSSRFPSNWELSTARATSVVKFLIDQHIPANRLIAAGFAHYHALDHGQDEIALRRNRRIEFKLTQR